MPNRTKADLIAEVKWLRARMADMDKAHSMMDQQAVEQHDELATTNERLLREATERYQAQALLSDQAVELARSEAALQEKTRILQSILNSIADGIVVANLDGDFLVFNPAGERIIGVGPTDAKPGEWAERYGLFRPDDTKTPYPEDELPLVRAMRGETLRDVVVFIRNQDVPKGCWVSVNATPLEDGSGSVTGGVVVFRDITAQRRNQEKLQANERLLRKMIDLQERERQLIAYELHDGLVQDVVGAQMALQAISSELESQRSGCLGKVKAIGELLSHAIDEGRRLISELRPLIIDEAGIVAAIEYLVAEERLKGQIEVRFNHQGCFNLVSPLLAGTIFRIVQEALTNSKRHSEADHAEIFMEHENDRIRLEILDQGVGFDIDSVPDDRFGLRSIRERARLFQGRAQIESAPGQGTRVFVELPVIEPAG